MSIVVLNAAERIGEGAQRLSEGDIVLREILGGLPRVPLESQSHGRNVLDERGIRLTPQLVGMKRLDLHGSVVAGSPHTYQRAHRRETRHPPGGQPPWIR